VFGCVPFTWFEPRHTRHDAYEHEERNKEHEPGKNNPAERECFAKLSVLGRSTARVTRACYSPVTATTIFLRHMTKQFLAWSRSTDDVTPLLIISQSPSSDLAKVLNFCV
jgi:hypothetical protein